MKPIYRQTIEIDNKATGKLLRDYRKSKRISGVEVAKELGWSLSEITRGEVGTGFEDNFQIRQWTDEDFDKYVNAINKIAATPIGIKI